MPGVLKSFERITLNGRRVKDLPPAELAAWRRQLSRDHYARQMVCDPAFSKKRAKERNDYYHANKAKVRKHTMAKHKANYGDPDYWARLRLSSLKARAKKLGLEFSLNVSDLIIPEVCPVLGIPLKIGVGKERGGKSPNSPSVDRINNSKGYIPSNVRIISSKANWLKRDGTLKEFEQIVAYMKRELDNG